MSFNANEDMLACGADADESYPDALNTGYADANDYLCFRIMSLYCISKHFSTKR